MYNPNRIVNLYKNQTFLFIKLFIMPINKFFFFLKCVFQKILQANLANFWKSLQVALYLKSIHQARLKR